MSKEAMKLALEALEQLDGIDTETECVTIDVGNVITALREALEEQQEPVRPSAYESLIRDMTTIAAREVPRGVPLAEFAMQALADAELREHDAAPQPAQPTDARACEVFSQGEWVLYPLTMAAEAKQRGWQVRYLVAEQPAQRTDDTKRLDALAENYWDLRCFDMPTGADDADIGWRVIEHHMAKPHERTVAEVFRDDPRQAIDAATEAAHGITKGGA